MMTSYSICSSVFIETNSQTIQQDRSIVIRARRALQAGEEAFSWQSSACEHRYLTCKHIYLYRLHSDVTSVSMKQQGNARNVNCSPWDLVSSKHAGNSYPEEHSNWFSYSSSSDADSDPMRSTGVGPNITLTHPPTVLHYVIELGCIHVDWFFLSLFLFVVPLPCFFSDTAEFAGVCHSVKCCKACAHVDSLICYVHHVYKYFCVCPLRIIYYMLWVSCPLQITISYTGGDFWSRGLAARRRNTSKEFLRIVDILRL